jgi:uncharacterized protein
MLFHSRRSFLKTSAEVAGFFFVGPSALLEALDANGTESPLARIMPFPLGSVRLGSGIFKKQEEVNARYLDSLAVDRLLYSFRATAGISSNAAPYGGWEAPTCELRGHFNGGHFLSAAALASAASGNGDLKAKGDQVVAGLAQCQKKIGTGYLSAFPTDLFEHLAEGKQVWAPFYTCHKIMAGLLDMYVLTGNEDALAIAEGMARWVGDYFWPIGTEQRQRMLRDEYGGMNEVLVNLAAVTKKDRYLETAHLFEQPSFLDPLAARRDELQGLHANTHVPKVIGAARMYEVTGDSRYRQIAEYFLGEVLAARSYVIGNTSVEEFWKTPPGQLQGSLQWKNAECCVAYNLMKLERLVFGWTGGARWMDAYERALFNCRLGTQNEKGLKQYFFPLAAGYWRAYNTAEESFLCCTGTGAEEFAKFSDTIYFHRGGDVYVNQFLASTLDWKEEGFAIEQQTQFPREQGTRLILRVSRPATRTIHVRIPGWTRGDAEIKVNGRSLEAVADPGSYLAIRRTWRDGDTIDVSLPMRLWTEPLSGDESTRAALYGPLALAADLGPGPTDQAARSLYEPFPKVIPPPDALPRASTKPDTNPADWIRVDSAVDLRFTASSESTKLTLMPLYEVEDQRYAVYWNLTREKDRTA